ncbi:MAG TPA: hypothetical protein VL400_09190 [Polyangiaceae bacterium]|nr:hypothetical protein [Polyangiaceae bacterium]
MGRSSGRRFTGVANVASTKSFTPRCDLATTASASRSTTRRYGFVGSSVNTTLVLPGTSAARTASAVGSTTVDSTPNFASVAVTSCRVRR